MLAWILTLLWPDHDITQVAIALVLGFALLALVGLYVPFMWRLFRVYWVMRRLRLVEVPSDQERRGSVEKEMKSSPLQDQWSDFYGRWSHVTDRELGAGRTAVRMLDVFEERPLIAPGIRRSLLGALPGIFIAIGVLGTFVGLTIATTELANNRSQVSSSQVTASATESEDDAEAASVATPVPGDATFKAEQAVSELTANLGLAFRTSILGLALSILCSLGLRIIEGWSVRLEDEIDREVRRAFPWKTQAEVEAEASRKQADLIDSLKDSLTDMMHEYEELSRAGFGEIRAGLEQMTNALGDEQREALSQVAQGLSESLKEGIGTYLAELQVALSTAVEQQQNLSEHVAESFRLMDQSAVANREVANELRSAASAVEVAAMGLESCSTDLMPTVENISTAGTALELTATSMKSTQEASERTASEVRISMELAESALAAQREMVESSLGEIRGSISSLSQGLADDLVGALGRIDGLMETALGRLSGTVGESNETLDRLGEPLGALSVTVDRISVGIQETGKQLGLLSERLDQRLGPVENLGESIREYTEVQNRSRESSGHLLERIETKTEAILELGSQIEKLGSSEGETNQATVRLAQKIDATLMELREALSKNEGWGDRVVEAIRKIELSPQPVPETKLVPRGTVEPTARADSNQRFVPKPRVTPPNADASGSAAAPHSRVQSPESSPTGSEPAPESSQPTAKEPRKGLLGRLFGGRTKSG